MALVGNNTSNDNLYNIESGAERWSLFTRIDSCPFFSLQGICVDAFCQIIVIGCSGGRLKL
ncbi:hypothetical protein T07_3030 [Trichinella nelsoni]|uniref:Uncharacterized protein n=1 Tax=Trichinella nelsoni TaxID=6336 RepID=A0A0V0SC98_9BILA|nr:hypothetical protein T07_9917 [Trichinella nelsoni]KRX24338.1 hypothetical protein T07_3030 [Trichinella nelsoni]